MPCLLQVSVCVCLGLTQLIQCREYRFAVKVSTCNNLPSKFLHHWQRYNADRTSLQNRTNSTQKSPKWSIQSKLTVHR